MSVAKAIQMIKVSQLENYPPPYSLDMMSIFFFMMIQVIMVHPEATFDSHLAYNLLSQCPVESVEEAYSYLKSSGMVVLSKHGDNRRVPGRKFRMSNR
jgi:hypothetical protein